MANILLLHADPAVASRIQHELAEFSIVGVRSIESVLNMISDLRYELLLAQESLIKPWVECIEGQRPAMPIITIADEPADDDRSWRALRNAVIGLTERWFLDHLASTRPVVHLAC